MSNRSEHRFEFKASEIAVAAKSEAEYHRARVAHWKERQDAAVGTVQGTISAKLTKQEVTGGQRWAATVDYGDFEAWQELQLAASKIEHHLQELDRYETDARVYSTQGERPYELDTSDVHHFRLGGQKRES